MSFLGKNAQDIMATAPELCLILGYLAKQGRIVSIDAEIPEDRVTEFQTAFPGSEFMPITQGETANGNVMKQGCQFRINICNLDSCPMILANNIGAGRGRNISGRINKGAFVEKLVVNYAFKFGSLQDPLAIRSAVLYFHPSNIADFDKGFSL